MSALRAPRDIDAEGRSSSRPTADLSRVAASVSRPSLRKSGRREATKNS
jgi:hypothetical protein